MDAAQQLKLRERQRFFEEAFQHDVDVYFSSAHLQIDYKRGAESTDTVRIIMNKFGSINNSLYDI